MPGSQLFQASLFPINSRTARRAAARIAFQTRAVADQSKIPAFSASFAFVALGAGFGAFLGGGMLGVDARVGAVVLLQQIRR